MQDVLIIYVSRATHIFGTPALQHLAAEAGKRNTEKKITGLLIKVGNYFLQVLEGPVGPVRVLLDKIAEDPRHRELRVLYKEPCEHRLFAQWSMGCVNLDEQYVFELKEFRQLRERVHQMMTPQNVGKAEMMEVIKAFPLLLQEHKAAA